MQAFTDNTFADLNGDLSASINVVKPDLSLKMNDTSNTTTYTHISNNATNNSHMVDKETNNAVVNSSAKEIQTELDENIAVRIAES